MAGGTHVFDMIKRLKENGNLKKKNYFEIKETYTKASQSINVDYKNATQAEREEIRKKVISEGRAEAKKSLMILMFSVLVTAVLIFLVLKLLP
ncbi:hypothetical protein [Chryseolinea sp. H1M3-3]|uniref:hypothetical protein n=1 Tax=Chryseolinea sp. H1M3-3 TaxID=3034144 RepID=UPI0023ED2963|nr:hypothetical protein [Chryseolinea sp. H1M3-3]